jgi:PAS domain S-box-containing protein
MKKKRDQSSEASELRRQAEAMLSERKKREAAPPATESDTRRLLHEMEVHQIELEMQNDELIQARAELEAALRQYTDLYDFTPVGYFTLAHDGAIHQVNLAGANLLGLERGALIKRRFGVFVSVEYRPVFSAFLEKIFSTSGSKEACEVSLLKDGSAPIWAHIEATTEDGQREACRVVVVDITEQKQAEKALESSEKRLQAIVEHSLDEVSLVTADGTLIWESPTAFRPLGHPLGTFEGRSIFDLFHPDDRVTALQTFSEVVQQSGSSRDALFRLRHQDGTWRWMEGIAINLLQDPAVGAVVINYHDITERKQAEQALRESEEKHRTLFETMTQGVVYQAADGKIISANPAAERILGLTLDQMQGRTSTDPRWKAIHEDGSDFPGDTHPSMVALTTGKDVHDVVMGVFNPELEDYRWININAIPQFRQGETVPHQVHTTFEDITEHKRAEEALRQRLAELEALHTVSAALRAAQTRDEALPILLDEMLAALETEAGVIWLYHPEHNELRAVVARGWFRELSETSMKSGEGIGGTVFASGQAHISVEFRNDPLARVATGEQIPDGWGGVCVPIRAGAVTIGVLYVSLPLPRQITPQQVRLLESLTNMAGATLHRMSLYEATVRQLDQLQALHRIDMYITASMDLNITINILLEHVKTQLSVDAACVLLLNPHTLMLEYYAGRGFRTSLAQTARFRLGESYAGRAALECRAVQVGDLAQIQENLDFAALCTGEGFVAYYGVPLIAKGQVKGVLEVFQRAPLAARQDWVSFLETLAETAAIAIDSVQLFDGLQRSKSDLSLAYDATIEGWSHALDLRDKETEGHTQRVTELTRRLARAMGIGEAEMVHIRRGSLLHDIGKMGLPDIILLKQGKLTDEEWMLMRQHPRLAYEMLSPINYLRPALDIPYCHHEKWDGSGYPQGLKGEGIPLAARLFAVVDVWDALRSDRPYREAWPEEKVLKHIKAGSGTHFDPKAVELFLMMMSENDHEHGKGAG